MGVFFTSSHADEHTQRRNVQPCRQGNLAVDGRRIPVCTLEDAQDAIAERAVDDRITSTRQYHRVSSEGVPLWRRQFRRTDTFFGKNRCLLQESGQRRRDDPERTAYRGQHLSIGEQHHWDRGAPRTLDTPAST
jgi:hypothetical protein